MYQPSDIFYSLEKNLMYTILLAVRIKNSFYPFLFLFSPFYNMKSEKAISGVTIDTKYNKLSMTNSTVIRINQ